MAARLDRPGETLSGVETPKHAPTPFDIGHFARHYGEMVVAMLLGMVVYGVLFRGNALSRSYGDEALMAAFMTAPMIGWMLFRRHNWRQVVEMTLAMLVPGSAVVVFAAGEPAISDRALGIASHVAMLVGMLALMIVRRAEYGHPEACHRPGPSPRE